MNRSTRIAHRENRVYLLLTFVTPLSTLDLFLTLHQMQASGMAEANPIVVKFLIMMPPAWALTTQSNFMNRKWDVLDKTVVIGTTTLTMQNLVVPGSTTSSNYLNAFMSVTPKHGVSFTPGGTILGVIYPFNF